MTYIEYIINLVAVIVILGAIVQIMVSFVVLRNQNQTEALMGVVADNLVSAVEELKNEVVKVKATVDARNAQIAELQSQLSALQASSNDPIVIQATADIKTQISNLEAAIQ